MTGHNEVEPTQPKTYALIDLVNGELRITPTVNDPGYWLEPEVTQRTSNPWNVRSKLAGAFITDDGGLGLVSTRGYTAPSP